MIFRSTRILVDRHHRGLDVSDGLRRIEPFGAGVRTVHDGMAAVELEGVIERLESLLGSAIAGVFQPALGLKEH